MSEKIIGWLLTLLGLFIIIAAGINAYTTFTGSSAYITPFSFNDILISPTQLFQGDTSQLNAEPIPLVEAEMINKPLNLTAHIILLGFLASIGTRIAMIGAQLVRTINVELKQTPNLGKNKEQKNVSEKENFN